MLLKLQKEAVQEGKKPEEDKLRMAKQVHKIINVEEKLVLACDICSSSSILEGLILRGEVKRFYDLLLDCHDHFELWSKIFEIQVDSYKFTGDGWILLFPPNTDGKSLLSFIELVCSRLQIALHGDIVPFLDSKPKQMGINFGIDRGQLLEIKMGGKLEYIGRPLTVACRLQSSIKDDTSHPAYKVLMSNTVYQNNCLKLGRKNKDFGHYLPKMTSRCLRNILGSDNFECVEFTICEPDAFPSDTYSESIWSRGC